MTKKKKTRVIEEAITPTVLWEYLTADYGWKLGVYADGSVAVGPDIGREIDETPIAIVWCRGLENIHPKGYAYGWAEQLPNGMYRDIRTQEEMTEKEMLWRCCQDGDVSQEIKDLIKDLVDSIQE